MSAVLHELLAKQGDIKGQHAQISTETQALFSKADMFSGSVKELKLLSQDGDDDTVKKANEAAGSAINQRTTSVHARLGYDSGYFINMVDLELEIAATNRTAAADIVVDGVKVATDVPGTYLIYLEKALEIRRGTYAKAPVIPNSKELELASDLGKGIWKLKTPEVVAKTETKPEPLVLYPATDKHPAQVKEVMAVKTVGTFVTTREYGMLTSAQKMALLANLDKLIMAVKQARARANSVPVITKTIGKSLIDFIEGQALK